MNSKLQPMKPQKYPRNLMKKREEERKTFQEIDSSKNRKEEMKKNDGRYFQYFPKSATVHSNMINSNLGFTESLIKSTAEGTSKENVR